MNTDLNISSSLRQATAHAPSGATAAPAQAAAVASTAATSSHAPIKAPAKVKLQVDPEQTRKNLQEAIERLNDHMKKNARSLNFRMDDVMNTPVVTVRSTETGEVVRQIPNETVIHVAHNIESMKGLLHNSTS